MPTLPVCLLDIVAQLLQVVSQLLQVFRLQKILLRHSSVGLARRAAIPGLDRGEVGEEHSQQAPLLRGCPSPLYVPG